MLSMLEMTIILVFWHKYETVVLHYISLTANIELDLLCVEMTSISLEKSVIYHSFT